MTDSRKYDANIASKGLDATGVTEAHARRMAATLGEHTMLIVEAKHARVVTDSEGKQKVTLTLTNVEPVPAAQEDKVREFQRALYRQRPDQEGQAALRGTSEGPSVAEAAAALDAEVDRDEDGVVRGIWDGATDGPLTADEPDDTEPDEPDLDTDEPEGDDGEYSPT